MATKKEPRPNLFLIGAMKSGTTSLHEYLAGHPQIFMCTPKEPAFFSEESNWAKGEKWYLKLFDTVTSESIVGESSTSYSKAPHHPGVPDRIATFNPEARLAYIMRDPVKRTISHYWFNVRFYGERRNILTAISEDRRYQDVSNYLMQLAPYRRLFGAERIATLTFEELVGDTLNTVQKLFAFLGVDSSIVLQNLEYRKNVTPARFPIARNRSLDRLLRAPFAHALKPKIPSPVISLASRMCRRYESVDRSAPAVDKVVEFLRPIQREQVHALSETLGRRFPEWTTLCEVTAGLLFYLNEIYQAWIELFCI